MKKSNLANRNGKPNGKTLSAFHELNSGRLKPMTIEEFKQELRKIFASKK